MIAADAELLPLARALGEVRGLDGLPVAALKGAELLLIAAPRAWERVRAWRAAGVAVGVVVVGATAPEDRARLEPVVVLDVADPAALVRARARLAAAEAAGTVALAGGVADLNRSVFRRDDGGEARLTGLETRLLAYLSARAGRAVGHAELQEQVWEHPRALDTRAVEVAIMRLRRKVEADPAKPVSLLTVRGEGYRVVRRAPAELPEAPRGRGPLLAALVAAAATPGVGVLAGPAGVGKSTLLRAVARAVPAAWVDLDGAPPDPWTALAVGLGVALPAAGPAAPAVLAALAARGQALVCLDHADHHLDGLAAVGRALGDGGVAVLLASRRVPGWEGARVHPVAPLEPGDALALLEARSGVTGPEVAEIAERLDRLPLALELVAARLAAVGPEVVLDALRADGSLWVRARGQRHPSMREAVAWSVARATPEATAQLAALAVFPGPFEAKLAAEVAGVAPRALIGLVDDGLLARVDRRFRLLHAVREYAAELRPEAVDRVRPAYVAAIAARARAAVAELDGAIPRAGLDALRALVADLHHLVDAAPPDADPDRLDAALGLERVLAVHGTPEQRRALLRAWGDAADEAGRARVALRLAAVDFHGDRDGALARLDAAAARAAGAEPARAAELALQAAVYAFAHRRPGEVLARLGAIELRALSPADRARADALTVRCRHKLGEIELEAHAVRLVGLGAQLLAEGHLARATEVTLGAVHGLLAEDPVRAEAVLRPMAERVDDLVEPPVRCLVLVCAAQAVGEQGRTDEALALLGRAEAVIASVDPVRRWLVAHQRGRVLVAGGRVDAAREAFGACLAWWRVHDWASGAYDQQEQLAIVELVAGRAAAAAEWAREARATAQALDDRALYAEASTWLAAAAALGGDEAGAEAALAGMGTAGHGAGGRLVLHTLRARLDPGAPAAAELATLLARLPAAHPGCRIRERLMAAVPGGGGAGPTAGAGR